MSSKSMHHHFNRIDILIAFVSLCTFALDVGTDMFVCLDLFLDGHKIYGWLMVGFIVVPAILMNAFSIAWHMHDKSVTWHVILSHILMLAPAQRYCTVIKFGIKSHQTHKAAVTQRALRSQSDVSILRLFEAFLESAPQLVLQLYIIFHNKKDNWFTELSAVCSLLSLTWAMTAYSDSQRRAHNSLYKRRLVRLLMHWSWHLLMTSARIAAFVFCAFALHNWVLAVMGAHWLIAFIWISVRGTDFGTDCCERWMFRLVCGFIYIFVFLNLNDGMSRWRVTAYYILVLLENTGMLVAYLVLKDNTSGIITACVLVYGAYMLGLVCMAIYYSYLHPSGRKKSLQLRKHNADSRNFSRRDDPQIFSIESPKLQSGMVVLDGTGINLTADNREVQNSVLSNQLSHASETYDNQSRAVSVSYVSQQALRAAWQNGMVSSSSSSSTSLTSENKVQMVETAKRTPSVCSANSQVSACSQNELLPSAEGKRNDLSKLSKSALSEKKLHDGSGESEKDSRANVSMSDNNLNVHSSLSGSPTLSRGSWTRLSDHNRQSLTLDDFTVLGFDDSSSERRPSDCSSLNSQPKSLSPINVSSLWKDVHSRLRATIAATIAAATSNPSSSSEGTPNCSQSLASFVSSGQEDNLISDKHTIASVNAKKALMGESLDEALGGSLPSLVAQDLPNQREDLSSLPDIPDSSTQDQMSDMTTSDSSYKKQGSDDHLPCCGHGAVIEISDKSPSMRSNASFTSYPEDSTLTASKLDIKRTSSYLEALKLNGMKFDSTPVIAQSDEPLDLSMSSTMSASSLNVKSPIKKQKQKKASPFTDQELVTVMAKSLQGYLRAMPGKSPNLEREGLALTIDDLRISRESTPEPLSNNRDTNAWKSRSASSLFHDSNESSPASSASKMNLTASIVKAEAKLSPNAWKQLEVSPPTANLDSDPSQRANLVKNKLPTGNGLKFIMDSYAQASLASPRTNQSHSRKSENTRRNESKHINCRHKTTSQYLSASNIHPTEVIPDIAAPNETHTFEVKKPQHHSFDSSPGPGLSARDLELSTSVQRSQAHSGISYTKRPIIHHANFPVMHYSKSPCNHQESKITLSETDLGSEAEAYVAGQYCPPLCANIKLEPEKNTVDGNINNDWQHSFDLNSIHKNIHNGYKVDKISRDSVMFRDQSILKNMRKEVMKKNLCLERQNSDVLHLKHPQDPGKGMLSYHSYSHSSLPQTNEITSPRTSRAGNPLHSLAFDHQKSLSMYDDLSEEELQKSARRVADYFSRELESGSYHTRSARSLDRSTPQNYYKRVPLQQLDNAQYLSPKTSSYHKSMSRSHVDKHARSTSTRLNSVHFARSQRGEVERDSLRQKLSFETE
ncbi:Xk-related protein [Plakobranchus ocellatus]|uniref:XK-related protein n=1 Tax=Plakobranchus ocellatus TaxID=259542 RepID=A0AAV4CYU0_9GAST|nr:Xk-related protein [Plakobranchus ocellatus]